MKRTSWVAFGSLALLGAFIVYSSLEGEIRCEVCIEFEGRTACREVDGATEEQALTAARTNACAQLASGVTQTMACERTKFATSSCKSR